MEEQKDTLPVSESKASKYRQNRPGRARRFWLLTAGGMLTLLIIGAIVVGALKIWILYSRLDDIEWRQRLAEIHQSLNTIEPEVNVMQFLKRGYTIELEEVSYSQDGLRLSGYLGNPTTIYVHNVCLRFSARKHESFDEFRKKEGFGRYFYSPEEIGNAQTEAILWIAPGKKGQFKVTIPNVRQTKEGFQLTVSFSGERYSYY